MFCECQQPLGHRLRLRLGSPQAVSLSTALPLDGCGRRNLDTNSHWYESFCMNDALFSSFLFFCRLSTVVQLNSSGRENTLMPYGIIEGRACHWMVARREDRSMQSLSLVVCSVHWSLLERTWFVISGLGIRPPILSGFSIEYSPLSTNLNNRGWSESIRRAYGTRIIQHRGLVVEWPFTPVSVSILPLALMEPGLGLGALALRLVSTVHTVLNFQAPRSSAPLSVGEAMYVRS